MRRASIAIARARIRKRITEIEADTRYQSGQKKPATTFENAPLALIQLGYEVEIATLRWCLKLLTPE